MSEIAAPNHCLKRGEASENRLPSRLSQGASLVTSFALDSQENLVPVKEGRLTIH